MELINRENLIIAGSIVVAVVAYLALGVYTDLGDVVRYAVLIGIGVILPMIATNYYSS